ncbi:MAG: hypothetical protein LWW87_04910 [Geobacteraceae bacterium]|nr:hypothetical protein [Geobacteraceae bacterium]
MKRLALVAYAMLLLLTLGTPLSAGDKPDIIHYTAQYLDRALHVTLQWQSTNPVTLARISAGREAKEIKVDEYDNHRVPGGYTGEVTVNIPVDAAMYQKDVSYVLQLEDDLRLKSELVTGKAQLPVTASPFGSMGPMGPMGGPQQDTWGQDHLKPTPKSQGGAGTIVDKLIELKDKFDLAPSITQIKPNVTGPNNVTFSLKANDDKQLREINIKVFDAVGNMVQTQQITGLGRVWEGTSQVFTLSGGAYRVVAQAVDSTGNTSKEVTASFEVKGGPIENVQQPTLPTTPITDQQPVTSPATPVIPSTPAVEQPPVTPTMPVTPAVPVVEPSPVVPPSVPAVTPPPVEVPPVPVVEQPPVVPPAPPVIPNTPAVVPPPVIPTTTPVVEPLPVGIPPVVPACPAGQTICSSQCTDILANPQNCGACGNVCSAGQLCVNGVCTTTKVPATANGQLVVYIEPIEARKAGAMWQGPGLPWFESGNQIRASVNSHQIIFKPVSGFQTPSPAIAVVKDKQLTTLQAVYKPLQTPSSTSGMQPLHPPTDPVVYMNGNIDAVLNGPRVPTTFNISVPHRITWIYTYHYFNGGKLPGTISLRHSDGTVYGPFKADGAVGQGGVANAYWFVRPNVEIKAGNYSVIDSDTATWSHNSGSGFAGFVELRGIKGGTQGTGNGLQVLQPPNDPIIVDIGNIDGVQNNPTKVTTFTLSDSYLLTFMYNYHYFNNGVQPGTIALRHSDGTMYGPWQASGAAGQGNVPNAYWFIRPAVLLKPGTYQVIDSHPATWSHNYGTQGAGFVRLWGVKQSSASSDQASAGVWDTSEGVLTFIQNGAAVTGSYSQDNGKIDGAMNGAVLNGYWTETSSAQRCATSRNGNYYWGKIRFTFSGNTFSGAWGYCDANPDHPWTGKKR